MDYIDGADLIANEAIEQVILNGEMRSYGLEIITAKKHRKIQWLDCLHFIKITTKTPGRTPDEIGINNGEWYSSAYDKLHNLAVTANYTLSEKWNFGGNFTLQSGQPVTFPNGQYVYQGITIPSYGERNENSLPIYHHLDFQQLIFQNLIKRKAGKANGFLVFTTSITEKMLPLSVLEKTQILVQTKP